MPDRVKMSVGGSGLSAPPQTDGQQQLRTDTQTSNKAKDRQTLAKQNHPDIRQTERQTYIRQTE